MIIVVSQEKYKGLSLEGEGELIATEDEDAFWAKVSYYQMLGVLFLIPMFVCLWIFMEGALLVMNPEPWSFSYIISLMAFLLAWVFVFLGGGMLMKQSFMEKMSFYDNGIEFAQVDWFKSGGGGFSVHLPWSELGSYRRMTHWRLGDIIYLPKYGLIVMGSMEVFEKVQPIITYNLKEDSKGQR